MLVTHEKTRELVQPLDDFYVEIVNQPDAVSLVYRNVEEMDELAEKKKVLTERERASKTADSVRSAFAKFAGTFHGSREDLIRLVGGRREGLQRAISEMVATGQIRTEGRGEHRVWTCA